jgi:hypothetical protein
MASESPSQFQDGGIPLEDLRCMESWVASARDYVVPTDDLRPRVLEAASGVSVSKLQERRIGYAIISVAIISVCWAGVWLWLTNVRDIAVEESANSISRRALEIHDRESVNIHQATVDAYEEWRSRSHRSTPTSSSSSMNEPYQPTVTPGSLTGYPF